MHPADFSFGLAWIPIDKTESVRKALSSHHGAHSIHLKSEGHEVVGICSNSCDGKIAAAAIWARYIVDGAIAHNIQGEPDETKNWWLCLAADGLPVPGYDIIGSESVIREKLDEIMALGVEPDHIHGNTYWLEDARDTTITFDDAIAAVQDQDIEFARLSINKPPRNWIPFAAIAAGIITTLAIGAWWYITIEQAHHEAQTLRQRQIRAEQNAKRRQLKLAENKPAKITKPAVTAQEMIDLNAWRQTSNIDAAEVSMARFDAMPTSASGFQSGAISWRSSGWSMTWQASSGVFDTETLRELAASYGASQTCNDWEGSCQWEANQPINSDGPIIFTRNEHPIDNWLAQISRATSGEFTITPADDSQEKSEAKKAGQQNIPHPAAPPRNPDGKLRKFSRTVTAKLKPILEKSTTTATSYKITRYTATGSGLTHFEQLASVLAQIKPLRVDDMTTSAGCTTWSVDFGVWEKSK